MSKLPLFVSLFFFSVLCGCNKPAVVAAPGASATPSVAATTVSPSAPAYNACALITNAEVEAVQGTPITEAKNSERVTGTIRISQCFYTAPEFSKSISLAITQTDPLSGAQKSARSNWMETFGRFSNSEQEMEVEKKTEQKPDKEEEKEVPPRKIEGLGDDAYWTSNRVGGALYVLKNDAFLRISIGGADTDEGRLAKCKALAEKALPRL